jgi:hypothetical protein
MNFVNWNWICVVLLLERRWRFIFPGAIRSIAEEEEF